MELSVLTEGRKWTVEKNLRDPAQSLNDTSSAFLVPLRMGKGFDRVGFESLCSVIRDCALAWRGNSSVPKDAAAILFDAYPTMVSCSYLYDDERAQQIQLAAEELAELIRDCLYS